MALLDEIVARREDLEQLGERAARKLAKNLDDLRNEAKDQLDKLKDYTDAEGNLIDNSQSRKRVKAAVKDLEDSIASGLAEAQGTLRDVKKSAFKLAYADMAHAVEVSSGQEVQLGGSFEQVYKEAVRESAKRPVLGVKQGDEFDRTEVWTVHKVKDALTKGILQGDSIDDVATELGKILDTTQAAAERIARTNINASMNDAHKSVYDENEDIFDGYVWDSTLDGRTSLICATLHGTFFPIGSLPPGPPAHPNCRSVLVGRFKDPDLQALEEEDTRRVRNIDGEGTQQIQNNTTFEQWLKRQPDEATKDITGSALKDDLWRSGKLPFDELTRPDFTTRTDKEALQLAMARRPDDGDLRELAKEYEVSERSLKAILADDKKLEKAYEKQFDYGVPQRQARKKKARSK